MANWRVIPANVRYNMVSSTLKIDAILPNPDVFLANGETIGQRYPFERILHLYLDGPHEFADMVHENSRVSKRADPKTPPTI